LSWFVVETVATGASAGLLKIWYCRDFGFAQVLFRFFQEIFFSATGFSRWYSKRSIGSQPASAGLFIVASADVGLVKTLIEVRLKPAQKLS